MAASGNGTLPASARQIYYQARPKIMAMTEDKELAYGYFSQTLLPDYIEEHGVDWNVVYDARGHFEEPHTNRRIGCGTIEVGNYLHALKEPDIVPAEFADASVDIVGPSGNLAAVLSPPIAMRAVIERIIVDPERIEPAHAQQLINGSTATPPSA